MLTIIGVVNWTLDADKYENDPELEKIRHDRGYSYQVLIRYYITLHYITLHYITVTWYSIDYSIEPSRAMILLIQMPVNCWCY